MPLEPFTLLDSVAPGVDHAVSSSATASAPASSSASSSSSGSAAVRKPVLEPEESIAFTADQTKLFLNTEKEVGTGTLWVTNKHVIWISLDSSIGYRLDYPYILLHAVCRDTSSFPLPCLYAQLDEELAEEEAFQGARRQQALTEDEEGNDDDDDEELEDADAADEESCSSIITELRFVPQNPDILDALWSAMSSCAALNPDEDVSDGEGDFLFDSVEVARGLSNGDDAMDYGVGGENAEEYDNSNDARLQGLQRSMGGLTAQEMYGEDDEEDGDEGEEYDEEQPDHPFNPLKSKAPDDPSTVAQQLGVAAAQVTAATVGSPQQQGAAQRKREREEDEEQAGPAATR